jgi:hypothetical protein
MAYPKKTLDDEIDEDNCVVNQIRETIFGHCFQPFLVQAYLSIRPIKKYKQLKSLNDFWNKQTFLENLECNNDPPEEYTAFGELLCSRLCFTHFMDGYLDQDVVNFDLCNSYLCRLGQLKVRYKNPSVSLGFMDLEIQRQLANEQEQIGRFIQDYEEFKKDPRFIFDDETIRFNFKVPSFVQR